MKRLLLLVLIGQAAHSGNLHAKLGEKLPGLSTQPAEYFPDQVKEADVQIPFAQPTEHFFTGRPYGAELGGFIFKYRNYDPELNRWTSSDPSGFPDGPNSQAFAPSPTYQWDFCGLMTYSWTWTSGATFGDTRSAVTTPQYATVTTKYVPTSTGGYYIAEIDKAFQFLQTGFVETPQVGVTLTEGIHTGVVDSTFSGSSVVHEGWHQAHAMNIAGVTYGALENWSASYTSNQFQTEDQALSAGRADLDNAYAAADSAFLPMYLASAGHIGSSTGYFFDSTAGTWRSLNPNWGAAMNATISGYAITFTKTPGNE